MFIATITPDAAPSSVGAAWMVDVALPQGFGESDGASGHKHAAPTGLGGLGGACGYKHAAPTGLGGLGDAFGYKHVAPTGLVRVVERAIKEAKPRQTCARRIGSEPRKRVVRKGTSRFQFVPVCGKPEQTGTLMGAGPGALPSAFICAICGSFPAGRAGGGPGAFKVQGSRFPIKEKLKS